MGDGRAVNPLRLTENGRTQQLSMAENAGFRNGGVLSSSLCMEGSAPNCPSIFKIISGIPKEGHNQKVAWKKTLPGYFVM